MNGIPDTELKILKDFLDAELRRCEQTPEACGVPAVISWQTRALNAVCDLPTWASIILPVLLVQFAAQCGVGEWLAPLVYGLLNYIVSRLQYVLAIALEVFVFLLGFFVFAVGTGVIWGGQRILSAAIYGDWEQVRDLAAKPNWGLSIAFSALKMTPQGRLIGRLRGR